MVHSPVLSSITEIEKAAMTSVENDFATASTLPARTLYPFAKKVTQALLKEGQLTLREYDKLVNNEIVAESLLQCNVFSFHPAQNTITFSSRVAEVFVQRNRSDYG